MVVLVRLEIKASMIRGEDFYRYCKIEYLVISKVPGLVDHLFFIFLTSFRSMVRNLFNTSTSSSLAAAVLSLRGSRTDGPSFDRSWAKLYRWTSSEL